MNEKSALPRPFRTLPDPSGPFRTLPDRCLGEASATFFGSPLRCHASFVPSITSVPPWQCMPWILVDCWGFPMFSCGFTMVFSMAKPIINYNKLIDFKFWSSFEGFHPFLMELGGLFFITRGTSKEFLTQLPPPKKKTGYFHGPSMPFPSSDQAPHGHALGSQLQPYSAFVPCSLTAGPGQPYFDDFPSNWLRAFPGSRWIFATSGRWNRW